jgi:hypothetical protein
MAETTENQIFQDGTLVRFRHSELDGAGAVAAELLGSATDEIETIQRRPRELLNAMTPGLEIAGEVDQGGDSPTLRWPAPGQRLEQFIYDEKPKDTAWVEVIGRALVEAIARLHGQGVGHGYLIPQLICVSGTEADVHLTLLGAELGPLAVKHRAELGADHQDYYLPPTNHTDTENTTDDKPDDADLQRIDLYALGWLLVELFGGRNAARKIKGKFKNGMPQPDQLKQDLKQTLPRHWQAPVKRLLEQDPHTTATSVLTSVKAEQAKRNRRLDGLFVLGVLALVSVASLWLMDTFHPARHEVTHLNSLVASLKRDKASLQNQIGSLNDKVNQLEADLAACRNDDNQSPGRYSKIVQSRVNPVWSDWVARPTGTFKDLRKDARSRFTVWAGQTDKQTANQIHDALKQRLKAVKDTNKWLVKLDGLTNIEKGYDDAKLSLYVAGREEWDERALTRKSGKWSFKDGEKRSIEWNPGDKIYLCLEVPGSWWDGKYDYKYIEKTATGPLALWRLGRVEGLGYLRKGKANGTASPASTQPGQIAQSAASSDYDAKLKLTIVPDPSLNSSNPSDPTSDEREDQ